MHKPRLIIISPAVAGDNNGNWQTASRWARMLSPLCRVEVMQHWVADSAPSHRRAELMIALHARRSADSIKAWKDDTPDAPPRPLLLALTGTDLYRDIDHDASAQASLQRADALVVLNERGCMRLPPALRERCHVLLQSCTARKPLAKTPHDFRALMVGHLRQEKDPATYWRAAERLHSEPRIRLDHVGAALEPSFARQAQALMLRQPRFRWLGGISHDRTRDRIQRAHVLVHASRMEGGAHVVIEALRSGTPVVASRIDGNLGLLGSDYPAVFEPGDDAALARMLAQLAHDRTRLEGLRQRCLARAALFAPERETQALRRIVQGLMGRMDESGTA